MLAFLLFYKINTLLFDTCKHILFHYTQKFKLISKLRQDDEYVLLPNQVIIIK